MYPTLLIRMSAEPNLSPFPAALESTMTGNRQSKASHPLTIVKLLWRNFHPLELPLSWSDESNASWFNCCHRNALTSNDSFSFVKVLEKHYMDVFLRKCCKFLFNFKYIVVVSL